MFMCAKVAVTIGVQRRNECLCALQQISKDSESVPLLLPCMVLFGVVVEHYFGCW